MSCFQFVQTHGSMFAYAVYGVRRVCLAMILLRFRVNNSRQPSVILSVILFCSQCTHRYSLVTIRFVSFHFIFLFIRFVSSHLHSACVTCFLYIYTDIFFFSCSFSFCCRFIFLFWCVTMRIAYKYRY